MNTVYSQFQQALKREKKTITTFYDNLSYPCLFRKVNDKDEKEYLTIYYDKSTPIETGKLLTYGGKQFITLNKESVENDVYFKSSLIQCNTTLEIVVSQRKKYIPCYAGDLQSPTTVVTSVITTLDGKVELITESTDLINGIEFNTAFVILGGTYQIANKYIKSGLTHLYVERTTATPVKEPVYELTLTTSNNQYQVGAITTFTANVTADGVLVDNPTLIWTSTNDTVATVTNGVPTFFAIGSTTITVSYPDANKSASIDLTVVAAPVVNTMTLVCSNSANEVAINSYRTFTATLKDAGGVGVPFTPVWTYNWNGMAASKFTITTVTSTVVGTNKIKIAIADDISLLNKPFDVICTTTDGLSTRSLTIKIVAGI